MTADGLKASYATCYEITRRAASNFYFGFLLLPREKRQAMHALYAFLRQTDDLGDDGGAVDERLAALAAWRISLDRALAGEFDSPVFPALIDTMHRYEIRPEWLHAVIDGVGEDQTIVNFATYADLSRYCYHVAGVVGLSCIHIWGIHDNGPRVTELAVICGRAFQLTNILRDLKEDIERGRVYLPQEDLAQFDYSEDDLRQGVYDDRFRALMRFEIDRTEACYSEAAELHEYLSPEGQAALGAMMGMYRGLLGEIRRRDGDVFTKRVRLNAWQKLGIAARSFWPGPMWQS
jgi:phytoene synthase